MIHGERNTQPTMSFMYMSDDAINKSHDLDKMAANITARNFYRFSDSYFMSQLKNMTDWLPEIYWHHGPEETTPGENVHAYIGS